MVASGFYTPSHPAVDLPADVYARSPVFAPAAVIAAKGLFAGAHAVQFIFCNSQSPLHVTLYIAVFLKGLGQKLLPVSIAGKAARLNS
jgi:hypothetical protein